MKAILVFVGTWVLTWMFIGLLAFIITDCMETYRQALSSPATLVITLVFGLIVPLLVTADYLGEL